MPRNTLDNALRFQKLLANQTTCVTCAIQQSLNTAGGNIHKSYLCLNCGEMIAMDCQLKQLSPCPACGALDYTDIDSF